MHLLIIIRIPCGCLQNIVSASEQEAPPGSAKGGARIGRESGQNPLDICTKERPFGCRDGRISCCARGFRDDAESAAWGDQSTQAKTEILTGFPSFSLICSSLFLIFLLSHNLFIILTDGYFYYWWIAGRKTKLHRPNNNYNFWKFHLSMESRKKNNGWKN